MMLEFNFDFFAFTYIADILSLLFFVGNFREQIKMMGQQFSGQFRYWGKCVNVVVVMLNEFVILYKVITVIEQIKV
jgi:hypothetical protein